MFFELHKLCTSWTNLSIEWSEDILTPFLKILSEYVGPMPFFVVPIFWIRSFSVSISLWKGKIKWALSDIYKFSDLNFLNSLNNVSRFITIPWAIMFITFLWIIPEGSKCKSIFLPSKTTVCPALSPPWYLTTTSVFCAR